MMHPAVLIECPRILFPVRATILAEATRQGGFPPLMLDPIDFAGMYQKRMAQQSAARRDRLRACRSRNHRRHIALSPISATSALVGMGLLPL